MPSRLALLLVSAAALLGCHSEPAATQAVDPVMPASPAAVEPAGAAAAPGPGACVGRGGEPAKLGMRNVLGSALRSCPSRTATGFHRDGFCSTGADDAGVHVVCATVTSAFLQFSAAHGNDLITARGDFPGLRDGDAWCLCAARFREALDAGVAPPVIVEATDEAALRTISSAELGAHPVEICREPR